MATRRSRGEGSLTQLTDGRWQARVTPHQDGKTLRRAFYGRTQAEARRKLTAALKQTDDNLPLPSDRLSLAAFLQTWLQTKEPDMRPESFRRYREACNLHIIPAIGNKVLARLTPADVQSCYAKCRAKGLSGTSVAHIHGTLHKALADAARWGRWSATSPI